MAQTGPYLPRRIGTSKKATVQPLLHLVPGRTANTRRASRPIDPVDINAPPLSDSSSDDEGGPSREGDITSTQFESKPNASKAATTRVVYGSRASTRIKTSLKRPQESDDEIDEPTKKAKGRDDNGEKLGSQFVTGPFQRPTAKPKGLYGTQKGYGKAAKPTSRSAPVVTDSSPEKPKKGLLSLVDDDDLDWLKDTPSPEKAHRAGSPNEPKERLAILDESSDFPDTPQKPANAPEKPTKGLIVPVRLSEFEDSPSPAKRKPKKGPIPSDDESSGFPYSPSPLKGLQASTVNDSKPSSSCREGRMSKAWLARQAKRKAKEAAALQRKAQNPTEAVSKVPDGLDCDSDLDIVDEAEIREIKTMQDLLPSLGSELVCPLCGEAVDGAVLDKFGKKRHHLSIPQQERICRYHQTNTARQTWIDRGYPDIDWFRLEKRITKHYGFLEDILNGGSSHFGTQFSKGVTEGKNRTVMKTMQSLTPGYYGTRGLRVMMDCLIDRFAGLLRKVAVKERLISARGHTTFVQCVLVPELAVRLIMEDMDVPVERARAIMEESIPVGEIVNEEQGDGMSDVDGEVDEGSDITSMSPLSSIEDGDLSDP